ncbi:MAG: hypothetical protein R2687_06785 [Candidatus Nanopelagicales bacterium]|jgi:predicted type IV restriction endonuclease
MSTNDVNCQQAEEFDGRLWVIQRLLRGGDVERARVETALLLADSEIACHDWVADQLQVLWAEQETRRTA